MEPSHQCHFIFSNVKSTQIANKHSCGLIFPPHNADATWHFIFKKPLWLHLWSNDSHPPPTPTPTAAAAATSFTGILIKKKKKPLDRICDHSLAVSTHLPPVTSIPQPPVKLFYRLSTDLPSLNKPRGGRNRDKTMQVGDSSWAVFFCFSHRKACSGQRGL